jgi:hypothetical protein
MARKASHPKTNDDAAQAAVEATVSEGTISKAEAVRRALAQGKESPADGVAFIRERFGLEMAPQHFSAVKSQQRRKEGTTPRGKRGRKSRADVEGYVAPPPATRHDGETDLIESLERLKPLIAQYGAEKVHRLVDLLG